jgi:uncharacterized protein (TIGR02646 family)
MKRIVKSEPDFFKRFISKKNPVNWEEISEIRFGLRKHILETEQNLQCAYCESEITSDNQKSHIDHFKRKHYFPGLTFDYSNLLVSCNNPNHCASHKDSKVKSKDIYKDIVNPVSEDPSDYFEYNISGKLEAKNKKAEITEKIFNLNHPGLRQKRKDVTWAVFAYQDSLGLEDVLKEIGSYESFIRSIW